MKQYLFLILIGIGMGCFAQPVLFDDNWRFHHGGAQGAESPTFDDSKWRRIDLPHDWSIEDLPGTNSPFDPDAISQVSGGYTVGGTGWYRKTFTLDEEQKNERIRLQFDGVYMNAECWLNGELLGIHPYGYTSFFFDLSGKIKYGEPNVLAVKVMNEGQNSRWYTGSGIYRHVWLWISPPVSIAHWGTSITTPEVNEKKAVVKIQTSVENTTDKEVKVDLITRIVDSNAGEVASIKSSQTIIAKGNAAFDHLLSVVSPQLWSVETPVIYTAINEVYVDLQKVEEKATPFGIRTISFSADKGFQLNGQPLKLKGGCVHHDNGPLGSKAYDRAEERRVELLKAAGYNAIRCAHNPPSPAFLDACDRLGMLVIDEAFDMWRLANNPYDYHLYFDQWWEKDIESMVLRDRNHPCIIMWSIGNEIRGMESPEVIEVARMLAGHIRQMEPTRPITAAVNSLRPQKDPFFSTLDVGGYNYAAGGDHQQQSIYTADHARVPKRVMVGTESYPLETFSAWMEVMDHDYVVGDFVWTAFDYIGEASIGWRGYWQESNFYPWNLAYCGDLDICGWKRPQSFYRDALWKENQLSLFVQPPAPTFPINPNRQSWSKWHWHDVVADWNWPGYENHPLEVTAYSSCEATELFLNERSLGIKKTDRSSRFMARWRVPYQPGELKVVGYKDNKAISQSKLITSKETSMIQLLPDRKELKANNQDLCFVTIELTDNAGVKNPKEERLLNFQIEGEGTIVGVGNANPVSLESDVAHQRKAWQGRCLVIIKTTNIAGQIKLIASADGLKPAQLVLPSK
jgi:beta-galactosidase